MYKTYYIYINILMNDDDLTSFSVTETMGIGSVGIISKMAWKTQKLQTLELYGKQNRSPILGIIVLLVPGAPTYSYTINLLYYIFTYIYIYICYICYLFMFILYIYI